MMTKKERAEKNKRGLATRRRNAAIRLPDGLNPATCDRLYDDEETEVLRALELYRGRTGRRFPTAIEVLDVLKSLGYRRCAG